MSGNYIKIDRKILKWEWWSDINTFRVFVFMLISAYWKDGQYKGIKIPRGSFPSSISELSKETNLTDNEVRTALKHLKSTGEITSKSTNKFTVFTIKNYDLYQTINEQNNKQITNKSQAINKLLTNNILKEDDKIKNERNSNGDLEEFFESIWTLYPVKRGKGSVSKTRKKKLQDIGYEQIKRCIERYVSEMESLNRDKKYWKNGSTFFNSGYVDYLDCNKDEKKKVVDVPEEETIIDLWSDV
jgi:DNA-binding transcriptional regulator YhcF (GntR family)